MLLSDAVDSRAEALSCATNWPGQLCPQQLISWSPLGACSAHWWFQSVSYLREQSGPQLPPKGQLQLPKSASLEHRVGTLTFASRAVTELRIDRQSWCAGWAGIPPATLSQHWLCKRAVYKPSRHAEMGWLFKYPSKSPGLRGRTSKFSH